MSCNKTRKHNKNTKQFVFYTKIIIKFQELSNFLNLKDPKELK